MPTPDPEGGDARDLQVVLPMLGLDVAVRLRPLGNSGAPGWEIYVTRNVATRVRSWIASLQHTAPARTLPSAPTAPARTLPSAPTSISFGGGGCNVP